MRCGTSGWSSAARREQSSASRTIPTPPARRRTPPPRAAASGPRRTARLKTKRKTSCPRGNAAVRRRPSGGAPPPTAQKRSWPAPPRGEGRPARLRRAWSAAYQGRVLLSARAQRKIGGRYVETWRGCHEAPREPSSYPPLALLIPRRVAWRESALRGDALRAHSSRSQRKCGGVACMLACRDDPR